ncbi:MAG: class I SAM-dependent methyltransferase [Anaerolineales bacterium]|jgi:2-polyprenyl-3-methyl-5-hydroxy-6-metoxy-1,4-benzoquinol methylase
MLPEIDKHPSQPDYSQLDKFFHNIDFLVPDYPRSSQYMVAIHQTFYSWVGRQVSEKTVLDAGCGEGYGVNILGKTAQRAVGVDVKEDLIIYALRRYLSANIEFLVMDCETLGFQKETFDLVVCNEMIEHLVNYKAFISGVFELLKPGGGFICATTNAELSFKKDDGSPLNRNHFQEFTVEQLVSELKPFTEGIQIYSEVLKSRSSSYMFIKPARSIEWLLVKLGIKHKIPIQWRNYVREKITGVKVNEMISEGFEIIEGYSPGAMYIIASCIKK